MRPVVAVCALVAALGLAPTAPALAEPRVLTGGDTWSLLDMGNGQLCQVERRREGDRALCGTSIPPDPGHRWKFAPSQECWRSADTDSWGCRPIANTGLSPQERAAILQGLLANPVGPAPNPGTEAGRAVLRSLCLSRGGSIDPATGTCYTPPPPPPVRCRSQPTGGGSWETVCN
jgi:hypothetical protein